MQHQERIMCNWNVKSGKIKELEITGTDKCINSRDKLIRILCCKFVVNCLTPLLPWPRTQTLILKKLLHLTLWSINLRGHQVRNYPRLLKHRYHQKSWSDQMIRPHALGLE